MSPRDRLRHPPVSRERVYLEHQLELLSLDHLIDSLGYRTEPAWEAKTLGTRGRVKLISADFPINSEPAFLEVAAYADLTRGQHVSITLGTSSGRLCDISYDWEGAPEQPVLSQHSVFGAYDDHVRGYIYDQHGRSPLPADLQDMVRERLINERAVYLENHPDERPKLDALESMAPAAAVGQPVETDISR